MLNHKAIRMLKDGEYRHGLQTTNLNNWAKRFAMSANCDVVKR